MIKNNATSLDVAKLANVSQATVSYVLNNTPGKTISEATRKRVLKAAAEINYTPNNAARVLKTNQSNCVSLRLATDITANRYYYMLHGIRSYLEPRGYNILLCSKNAQDTGAPDYINACVNTQADGIIYISSDNEDIPAAELSTIRSHNIPLVAVDCMDDVSDVSSVTYDYFASSYMCADYLIQKGFKKFYYIRPNYDNRKEVARERGVKAAVYSADGIELSIHSIPHRDLSSSEYSAITDRMDFIKRTKVNINRIINAAPDDACFVCSLGEFLDVLINALYQKDLRDQKDKEFPWHSRLVNYHFAHYEAGLEAARSLLNIINKTSPVRKLTLKPIIDIADPDLF